ncbi:MAG: DoxX family protein [Candidatus Peribacteraceae bacterium]|nr:DoxX family protein [Candidatus Peribacteraceae bacterium]
MIFPLTLMMSFYFLYSLTPWTMLFLRIALGAIFLTHGMPKVKAPQAMAAGMGMSSGMVTLVGLVEVVGAISLILGLFTSLGALGLAVIMIGAIYYKINAWKVPFSEMGKMGWEFDLILLAAALLLMTSGAGPMSLDATFGIY